MRRQGNGGIIPSRRTIVVTGASAGVGRATVRAFAREGARLGLIARGRDGLEGAKRDVERLGGAALVLQADVADADAVENAAAEVEREFGPIDVWVNNAMTSVFSRVQEMTAAEYKRVTEVTYLGYVHGTLAALKRMQPRDRGVIIQVGSALAYRGIPLQSAYCAAKHAIQGFCDSLRCELLHDESKVQLCMVQMPALNTPQFGWVKSRLPRKAQPVPPIYQPEIAADAIVYGSHNPRREIWVGAPTVVAIIGNKIAPGLGDQYLARNGFDGQQTSEPADPNRANNLLAPVPGDHGARGSFDRRAWQFSSQWTANKNRGLLALAALAFGAAVLYRRSVAALVLGAFLAVASAQAAVTESHGYYTSGGKKILVEQYLPDQPGHCPALILLHGSGGVLFPGLDLRKRARAFAEEGYAVFLPHFFDRTGHFMVRPSMVHQNLPVWTSTVEDCVSYVAANPSVNAGRIALLGHSLGGYLSLETAARDRRVKAVVEASGALDRPGVERLPPILILHGAKDKTVPVAKAEALKARLDKLGTPYQAHIYPDEPHLFSRAAMRDATGRIDRFLTQYFPSRIKPNHNKTKDKQK